MKTLLQRTLPITAAACVLLAAGSWLVAQPGPPPTDADRAGPPRSMTDDAFDDAPQDDRDRPRGPHDRMEQLGEHLGEVLLVLEDIDPDMADRLRQLPEQRPGLRAMAVKRHFPEAFRLARLRRDDPAMYQLRVQDLILYRRSQALAKEIRLAKKQGDEDDTADDLTDTLEDVVEQHFDVQQELRELELERLKTRIDTLEDALDDRDDRKDELIAQRFRRLLENPPKRDRPHGDRRHDRPPPRSE